MLKIQTIPLSSSGVLNRLVKDYLDRKPELRDFYEEYPDLPGIGKWLKKNSCDALDRKLLSEILLKQHDTVGNGSEPTKANIIRIREKNCYTVTTGHQLCLFTGPLYFVYKIFSTIVLAEKLRKEFSDYDFVPVYWMASEDHDFDEIRHLHIDGNKISWESRQTGAVGEFRTEELKTVVDQLRGVLGSSPQAKELIQLFENAYLKQENLALATRHLVNALFGTYGLITIDANDRDFKNQFRAQTESDLFDHTAFQKVREKSQALEQLGYHVQVNAREINLFYLEPGSRLRIERDGANFKLTGTDKKISADEMKTVLQKNPESLSPNVVLRPLYQQKILPNVVYVGGPGELAYWLEFKSTFEHYNIPFPVLVPRSFVTVLNKSATKALAQLQTDVSAFYIPEHELMKMLQEKLKGVFSLNEEEDQLRNIFETIRKKTRQVDVTLDAKVNADLQRTLNAIESIVGKTNRAIRRSMDEQKTRVHKIKAQMFRGESPQERVDNFAAFYLQWGPEFFDTLYKTCDPLALKQILMLEDAG